MPGAHEYKPRSSGGGRFLAELSEALLAPGEADRIWYYVGQLLDEASDAVGGLPG